MRFVCRRSRPRGYGVLGVVDSDRVVYYRDVIKRHTAAASSTSRRSKSCRASTSCMIYQGASGDIIKAMVDQGAKGIVIASAGAGATSGTQGDGILYAIERGVFVVTSTRAGGGRIAPRRANDLSHAGSNASSRDSQMPALQATAGRFRIAAEDLAPLKARILLMLALTATKDDSEIQRMFAEY